MDKDGLITVKLTQSVLMIGLCRPEKKNAITHAMYTSIREALESARTDTGVRVVMIHGSEEFFSSGNDLEEFNRRKPGELSPGAQFLAVLQQFEKPVLAAVSGLAVGVGVTLLLHCDLVYASPETRFRMPFVNLGLCPEAGSTLLLPANAGYRQAAKVLMLGDFFDTKTAVALGLVTESVSGKTLMAHAMEQALRLARRPQEALLATKRLMKLGLDQQVREHMPLEFDQFSRLLASPESREIRARMTTKTPGS
ncbi:MAG: enoyl-CoA hydratase [Pseudomonadota bacterium]